MNDMVNNEEGKIGTISIADDVVASIAGIAALEVDGVSRLTGNISRELAGKLGKKNLAGGVKIAIDNNQVTADISLEALYGTSVKKISEEVQTKVKSAVETMTGLNVVKVNVVVSSIKIEK